MLFSDDQFSLTGLLLVNVLSEVNRLREEQVQSLEKSETQVQTMIVR